MERDRSFKLIAVVALVIAIAGVSLGFAAFTESLTINATATVNPEDRFTIQFSDTAAATSYGVIDATTGDGTAEISGDGYTINNISGTFVRPGNIVFDFYITNTSDYVAYLKNVAFTQNEATCAVKTQGEFVQNINAVCENMDMEIEIGTAPNTIVGNFADNNIANIVTNNSIPAKNGATYASVPVKLTLKYTGDLTVDGSITVDFGSIVLGYSTAS